jgi:hypothetical protein
MLLVTPVPSQRFQMKRAREQADAVEREKEGKDKAAAACWEKRTFAQGVDEEHLRLATFCVLSPLVVFCDDDDCVMPLSRVLRVTLQHFYGKKLWENCMCINVLIML